MKKRLDGMGRLVLDRPIRDALGLKLQDYVEIEYDKDCVMITKAIPRCEYCGEEATDKLYKVNHKYLCENCMKQAKKLG